SLKDNGARSDHFSSFASGVALLTHLRQATMWLRQRLQGGQGSLTSRLSGPIHIHDHPVLILSVPEACWSGQKRFSRQQIDLKLPAKCLNGWLVQHGKKTGERRTRGKMLPPKEAEI